MNIRPLGNRIVIEKVEAEEKTASGIVLPQSAQEQPQFAVVRAVGDEFENNEKLKGMIQIGDKVLYGKFTGTEVKVDGKEYIIVRYTDVLAVVEE